MGQLSKLRHGDTELLGGKHIPVPRCTSQIQCGLPRDRTGDSAARLTLIIGTGPSILLFLMTIYSSCRIIPSPTPSMNIVTQFECRFPLMLMIRRFLHSVHTLVLLYTNFWLCGWLHLLILCVFSAVQCPRTVWMILSSRTSSSNFRTRGRCPGMTLV